MYHNDNACHVYSVCSAKNVGPLEKTSGRRPAGSLLTLLRTRGHRPGRWQSRREQSQQKKGLLKAVSPGRPQEECAGSDHPLGGLFQEKHHDVTPPEVGNATLDLDITVDHPTEGRRG